MKTLKMDKGTITVLSGDDVLNPPREDGAELENEPIEDDTRSSPNVAEPVAA